MSCRFAGCATPGKLWRTVMERKIQLTTPGPDIELPIGRSGVFGARYPAKVGQLGSLYSYVPQEQLHPSRQKNAGENQDLYFATQLAFDALRDASMSPNVPYTVNGTVRIGYAPPFNASTVNWLQHTSFLDQTMDIIRRFMRGAPESAIDNVRTKLVESLPAPNAASFLLGAGYRFASWIARSCSFGGAATITDAGMISAAAAIENAIDDLETGRADVALAGAMTPPLSRAYLEGVAGEVEFSSKPELHPFAQEQDGTMPGEGGAFFVLKRRADALRDHDRIYALIRSVAIGHNSEDDPSAIFSTALERAGVTPATIGLIEADGSCIAAAEARELKAIQKIWGEHRPGAPLVGVGSVKGNIGHTLHAAIAAGLVKTALALRHRVLPPQIGAQRPIECASNVSSAVYLLNEARPWIAASNAAPRRAAVMGANFDPINPVGNAARSGRSAVIILEEEPESRQ